MYLRLFIISALLFLNIILTAQQIFPVQLNGILIPPHSLDLSIYTQERIQDLVFTATLNDPVESFRQVRLRLSVENNGQEVFFTDPNLAVSPIILNQFEPMTLDGFALQPYLSPFSFVGTTGGQGSLIVPEGVNKICVEVIDLERNTPISRKACRTGIFNLNQPPQLLIPSCGDRMEYPETQNLLFNWTPMHLGSGNSPGAVEYTFELVELLPGIMDPNDGFDNALKLYETTVMTPSLIYTQGEPLLEPDKNYGWRVQARSLIHPTSLLFANEGFSQVCTFSYTEKEESGVEEEEEVRVPPQGCTVFSTDFGPVDGLGASPIPLVEGDMVKLGYFDLEVLDASPGGDGMNGTGFVLVPMLKAKVQVNFTDLKVKNTMRVYGVGAVNAIVDSEFYLDPSLMVPGNIQNLVTNQYVENLSNYFVNENGQNKRTSQFDPADPTIVSLPMGIDKEINGEAQPLVSVTGMRFTERNAFMTCVAYQQLSNGDWMRYVGSDISLTPFGVENNSVLTLLDGVIDPINDIFELSIQGGTNGSGMAVDCAGFGSYDLEAKVLVSEEVMRKASNNAQLEIGMKEATDDPMSYLGAMDKLDKFIIPQLPGFTFEMANGVIDLNTNQKLDIQNSFYNSFDENQWRGLQMQVSVELPEEYDFTGGGEKIELGPNDLFIAEDGAHGEFNKTNLVSFEEGSIAGWRYSVDTMKVKLEASAVNATKLSGRVEVPILDEPFDYNGALNLGSANTQLNVSLPAEKRGMSLWKGELEVDATSEVTAVLKDLGNQGRQFFPYANLTGKLNIELDSVEFDNALAGNSSSVRNSLKNALGLPTAVPDFKLNDLKLTDFTIDPLKLPAERYSLEGFDAQNATIFIGGKPLEIGQVTLKYNPEQNEQKEELGLEIVVLDGNTQVQFTFWGKVDGTTGFEFDRIEVKTVAVNCNCTSFIENYDLDPSRLGQMIDRYYEQNYKLPDYEQSMGSLASLVGSSINKTANWQKKYEKAVKDHFLNTLDNGFIIEGSAIVIPFLENLKLKYEMNGSNKAGVTASGLTSNLTFDKIDQHNNKTSNIKELPIDVSDKLILLGGQGANSVPNDSRLLITGFELAGDNNTAQIEFTFLVKIKDKYLTFKPDHTREATFESISMENLHFYLQDDALVDFEDGFEINYLASPDETSHEESSYATVTCHGLQAYHVNAEYHVPHDANEADNRKINYYNYSDNTTKQLKVNFTIETNNTKANKSLTQFIAGINPTNVADEKFNLVMEDMEGLVFNFDEDNFKAWFDFNSLSDELSSIDVLPSSYSRSSGSSGVFRGLVFKKLQVHVRGFYSDNGQTRLDVPCQDFVFDPNFGLEGELNVQDVVPYSDNATMGGWTYSLKQFNFKFVNNMQEGLIEVKGDIQVPIFKEGELLPYYGKLGYKKEGAGSGNSGEFEPTLDFEVGHGGVFFESQEFDKPFELEFVPGMFLFIDHESSALTMDFDNDEFEPGCDLSGTATLLLHQDLATDVHAQLDFLKSSGIEFNLPGLTFQNLKINDSEIEANCTGSNTVAGIKNIDFGTWGISPGGIEQEEEEEGNEGDANNNQNNNNTQNNQSNSKYAGLKSKVKSGFQNFPISVGTPVLRCVSNSEYKLELPIALNLMREGEEGPKQNNSNAGSGTSLGGSTNAAAGASQDVKAAGLKAETQLAFYFKAANNQFAFDRFGGFDALAINGAFGPVRLTGKLIILKTEGLALDKALVWGKGFKALLELSLGNDGTDNFDLKKKGITIQAMTQFGKTQYGADKPYRYFFADLAVLSEVGIALSGTPPIYLHGGGGGFYYNMNRIPFSEDFYDEEAADKAAAQTEDVNIHNFSAESIKDDPIMAPGVSLSGQEYEPSDQMYGGHIKAVFSVVNRTMLAVDGELGIQFYKNDAGKLSFQKLIVGSQVYLQPKSIKDRATQNSGKFVGQIEMDFKEKILSGGFTAEMEYRKPDDPTGEGKIPAVQRLFIDPEKSKGSFYFKFNDSGDIEKWAIKAGSPKPGERMLAVFDNLTGPIPIKDLNIELYLQAGDEIDPLPSIDELIPEWNENKKTGTRYYDPGNHKNPGIAFGLALKVPKKEFTYLMFDAGIEAGIGFDASMSRYDKKCNGRTFGVNGWYFQAQMYAYLNANVAIRYKMPFSSSIKRFTVFDVQAGAFLKAQFPRPSRFKGAINGKYNILNGLVKGSVRFKFEAYDDDEINCLRELDSAGIGPLAGIKVVSQVNINNNDTDVPIFEEPALAFTMPVGKLMEFEDYDDAGNTIYRRYKSELKYLRIKQGSNVINGEIISEDYYSTKLRPSMLLKPQTGYTLEYKIVWKEDIGGNWVELSAGAETESIDFTTGNMPDVIARKALEYEAPGYKQRYWHNGYAKTELVFRPADYSSLFISSETVDNNGEQVLVKYDYLVRLTEYDPSNGTETNYVEFPLSEYPGSQTIEVNVQMVKNIANKFNIPYFEKQQLPGLKVGFADLENHLNKNKMYKMEIVRLPILPSTKTSVSSISTTAGATTEQELTILADGTTQTTDVTVEATTIEIGKRELDNSNSQLLGTLTKILYETHFATSKYNSLHEKLEASTKRWEPSSYKSKKLIGHPKDAFFDNVTFTYGKEIKDDYFVFQPIGQEGFDQFDLQRIRLNMKPPRYLSNYSLEDGLYTNRTSWNIIGEARFVLDYSNENSRNAYFQTGSISGLKDYFDNVLTKYEEVEDWHYHFNLIDNEFDLLTDSEIRNHQLNSSFVGRKVKQGIDDNIFASNANFSLVYHDLRSRILIRQINFMHFMGLVRIDAGGWDDNGSPKASSLQDLASFYPISNWAFHNMNSLFQNAQDSYGYNYRGGIELEFPKLSNWSSMDQKVDPSLYSTVKIGFPERPANNQNPGQNAGTASGNDEPIAISIFKRTKTEVQNSGRYDYAFKTEKYRSDIEMKRVVVFKDGQKRLYWDGESRELDVYDAQGRRSILYNIDFPTPDGKDLATTFKLDSAGIFEDARNLTALYEFYNPYHGGNDQRKYEDAQDYAISIQAAEIPSREPIIRFQRDIGNNPNMLTVALKGYPALGPMIIYDDKKALPVYYRNGNTAYKYIHNDMGYHRISRPATSSRSDIVAELFELDNNIVYRVLLKDPNSATKYDLYVDAEFWKNHKGRTVYNTGVNEPYFWDTAPEPKPYAGSYIQIPGRIEAEHFAEGENGIAYLEEPSSLYKFYQDFRETRVDLDTNTGEVLMEKGEWLSYMIEVTEQGEYSLMLGVDKYNGDASYEVTLNDNNILAGASFDTEYDGRTNEYYLATNVNLPAGQHILKIKLKEGSTNRVNYIDVQKSVPQIEMRAVVQNSYSINRIENNTSPDAYLLSGNYMDFGNVDIANLTRKEFEIVNMGSGLLNLTGTELIKISGPDSAAFKVAGVPSYVPFNSAEIFEIILTPDAGVGQKSAIVTIETNDPNNSSFSFPVKANILGPDINVSTAGINSIDTLVDVGSVEIGQYKDFNFTIDNDAGTAPLVLDDDLITINGSGNFVLIKQPLGLIQPGGGNNQNFIIRFEPYTCNIENEVVQIKSNDFDEPLVEFNLSGQALKGEIAVSGGGNKIQHNDYSPILADNTDMGNSFVGMSITESFTISNDGCNDVDISRIYLNDESQTNSFSISPRVSPSTNLSLAVGESYTFEVTFNPNDIGSFQNVINIDYQFPTIYLSNTTYSFSVKAIAEDVKLIALGEEDNTQELEPSGGDFPISNPNYVNTADAAIGTDMGTYFGGGDLRKRITINNISDVAIDLTSVDEISNNFIIVENIPSQIAPQNFASFDLVLKPGATESVLLGKLRIFCRPAGSTNQIFYDVNVEVQTAAPSLFAGFNGELWYKHSRPDMVECEFGRTNIGNIATETINIENKGDLPLTAANGTPIVTITGDHADDFTIVSTPNSTIQPGSTSSFDVQFSPQGNGIRKAILKIEYGSSSSIGQSDISFELIGSGPGSEMLVQRILLSGTEVGFRTDNDEPYFEFGSVPTGTKTCDFIIKNEGNATLNLIGNPIVTVSGANAASFVVSQQPVSSISAGGSATFSISYTSSQQGSEEAMIAIQSDANLTSSLPFKVMGMGTPPNMVLFEKGKKEGYSYTADIDINVPKNGNAVREIVIENSGVGPLEVSGYTVSNRFSNTDMELLDFPAEGIVLNQNETDTLQVRINNDKDVSQGNFGQFQRVQFNTNNAEEGMGKTVFEFEIFDAIPSEVTGLEHYGDEFNFDMVELNSKVSRTYVLTHPYYNTERSIGSPYLTDGGIGGCSAFEITKHSNLGGDRYASTGYIEITFSPTENKNYSCDLVFRNDDNKEMRRRLLGKGGEEDYNLIASHDNNSFASGDNRNFNLSGNYIVGQLPPDNKIHNLFTLRTNNGNVPLEGVEVKLEENSNGSGCSSFEIITGWDAPYIDVTFTPSSQNDCFCDLVVTHNGNTFRETLKGKGKAGLYTSPSQVLLDDELLVDYTGSPISSWGDDLDLGVVYLGETVQKKVTVKNLGNVTLIKHPNYVAPIVSLNNINNNWSRPTPSIEEVLPNNDAETTFEFTATQTGNFENRINLGVYNEDIQLLFVRRINVNLRVVQKNAIAKLTDYDATTYSANALSMIDMGIKEPNTGAVVKTFKLWNANSIGADNAPLSLELPDNLPEGFDIQLRSQSNNPNVIATEQDADTVVNPSESIYLVISFEPSEYKSYSENISIGLKGSQDSTFDLTLNGIGSAPVPAESIALDGVDDRLDLSSAWVKLRDINNYSKFSLSFWVKVAPGLTNVFLANTAVGTYIGGDGKLVIADRKTEANISDGQWHHIVWTNDGSGFKGYLDGQLLIETNGNNYVGNVLYMGWRQWWTYFKGQFDEISLWKVGLTANQVNNLYTAKPDPTDCELVAYYDFNQGTGGSDNTSESQFLDRSANAYHVDIPSNITLTEGTSNFAMGGAPTTGIAQVCTPVPAEAIASSGTEIINLSNPWKAIGAANNFDNYTLSMWVKINPANLTDNSNSFLFSSGETYVIFNKFSDKLLLGGQSINQSVIDNTWHHVAFVREGGTIKTYVDGAMILERNDGGRNANSFIIQKYKGALDDFSFWKSALSPTQITNLMTCAPVPDDCALVAYYDFNQGISGQDNSAENVLRDNSINQYDGILTNWTLSGTTSNFVAGGASISGTCAKLGEVVAEAGENKTINCTITSATLDEQNESIGATFSWSGPNDFSSSVQNPSVTEAGIYYLTVTNSAGCTATDYVAVEQNATAPPININRYPVITCGNPKDSLETLATGDYAFSWTGPNGFTSNTAKAVFNNGGLYKLVVTDNQNGCTASSEIEVGEDVSPPTASAGNDGEINCDNAYVKLDASASTSSMIYKWTGPNDFKFDGLATRVYDAGTYQLEVTNPFNKCTSADDVVVIDRSEAPIIDAGQDQIISASTSIGSSVNNIPSYLLKWMPALGLSADNVPSPVVSNINETSDYVLVVIDTITGCIAKDTITLTVLPAEYRITDAPAIADQSVDVSGVNFGTNMVGNQASKELRIWNTAPDGSTDLTLNFIDALSGYSFSLDKTTVSPNDYAVLTITFNPTTALDYNGSVEIDVAGVANLNAISIDVSGTGILAPAIANITNIQATEANGTALSTLDFGDVEINNSITQTIRIWNATSEGASLLNWSASINNDAYQISKSSGNISGQEYEDLEISLTPEASGVINSTLSISGGTDDISISLTGSGVVPVPVNIALNKPATSNGNYPNYPAANLVDGEKNDTKMYHSPNNGAAWVTVDLGDFYSIEEIKLTNRSSSQDRLGAYHLLISDTPFDAAENLNHSKLISDWDSGLRNDNNKREVTITVPANTVGRYVQFKTTDDYNNYVNLQEMEVFGVPANNHVVTPAPVFAINVAYNKTVKVSSIYGGDRRANLVDGEVSDGKIFHSDKEAGAWVAIDLGDFYEISELKIYNRLSCCKSRMGQYYMMISDTPFPETNDVNQTLWDADWNSGVQNGNEINEITHPVPSETVGRYVLFQFDSDYSEYINLREIKVYGLPVDNHTVTQPPLRESANTLHFDGSNDYVSIPSNATIGISNEGTWECWAFMEGTGNQTFFEQNLNYNSNGYYINYWSGKIYYTQVSNGSLTQTIGNDLPKNTWFHLAVTKQNGTVSLYVNGQLVTSSDNHAASIIPSNTPLILGTQEYNGNTVQFFDGKMDEVRVWKRALSATEIQHYKDCELTGSESDLIAYWNFNQGYVDGNNTEEAQLTNVLSGGVAGTLINFGLAGADSNWADDSPVSGNCGVYTPPVIISNVALNKTATSNGNYPNYPAANLVDGQKSDSKMYHSPSSGAAWVTVDLGNFYSIEEIKITNRAGCCKDRIGAYHLLISDTPFDAAQNLNAAITIADWDSGLRNDNNKSEIIISAPANTVGRYVQLRTPDNHNNYVNLQEMEVMGVPANSHVVTPPPQILQWQNLSAVNENTMWGIGTDNKIYRTNDGGQNWQLVNGSLVQVSALDYNTAWGVHSSGRIFRTNSGGQNWQQVNGILKQVSAVNYNTAWGVQSNDNIFRTNNGGQNWQQTNGRVKQISAIDYNMAWGVTSSDRIYRTSNGGQNWQQTNGRVKQVSAADYNTVWGVTSSGDVYRTNNGAQNWQKITNSLQEVSAISYDKCRGVKTDGSVYEK